MYTLIRENLGAALPRPRRASIGRVRVSGAVILLGLTSMLTDISSEMVTAVLPLYLVLHLQLSPLYFGFIDGLYQGFAAPLRLVGGFVADRWRRHKEVAATGYGISAFCKLGLLSAGSVWPGITGFLLLDRAGKGIRTAPRDALIAENSASESLGLSFGVHRAMDTLGALLGPTLAFVILMMAPRAFDSIFVVSFCIAIIGVAVIVLFVDSASAIKERMERAPTLLDAGRLLGDAQFRRILVIAAGLGLFTVSDGFLYLVLQRQVDFDAGFFPLLFVATAVVYFALAIPMGWLADRLGRGRILVLGYALLICTYTALLRQPGGIVEIGIYLVLFGAYYAATDGVLTAMASAALGERVRATGLAMLASLTGLSRFGGAILFGATWTVWGSQFALATVLSGMVVMTLIATFAFGNERGAADAG